MEKTHTKKSLREDYIITLAITLSALGKVGRCFYDNPEEKMEEYLRRLKKIDWSRKNKDWVNKTIRKNGKVLNSDEAIGLTSEMIKKYIGLK